MRSSLDVAELARYAARQVNATFPDGRDALEAQLLKSAGAAFERLEHCFSKVDNKYFFDGEGAIFNHLHGDQYAMWLYMLSNELFCQSGDPGLCNKLFLLNKALNGCDIFYEVKLPDIFLLVHPLGTVLGRGEYSDYFVAYQRCGVGSNKDVYPTFGRHVVLRPGSAVLGNSRIGDCCQIATESLVLDRDVPDHTLYIGGPKVAVLRRQESPVAFWRE